MSCSQILIFITLLFSKAYAFEIYTTHPQVTYSLKEMNKLYSGKLKFTPKSLFVVKASVHHFEPTIKSLMLMKKSEPLIAGPTGHQKWLIKSANLLPEQTLLLDFFEEQRDHFWLSSQEACLFEKKVFESLKEWKKIEEIPSTYLFCGWIQEKQNSLKKVLEEKKIKKVILPHNALERTFKEMNLSVIVLMEGDHHHEISAKKLKNSYQWLQGEDKVLLVKEEGFKFPPMLKGDHSIEWNPLVPKPQPLEDLIQKIKALP